MKRSEVRRRIARRRRSIRFPDLAKLLELYGWQIHRIHGSHHVFIRGGEQIVVPLRRPTVLPVNVDRVLKATEGEDDEQQER